MRSPRLADLPPPPAGRTGWPWTDECTADSDLVDPHAKNLRITIVTPSFNQGQFIEETIRSVLLQGYPDLEYIVMDGGSTDGTLQILERYSPWLSFWISEPDAGQSDAIARGFERASGKLLAWLCSDDVYLPGALAFAAAAYARDPAAALICGETRLDQGKGWEDWMGMQFSETRPTRTRLLGAGQCIQQPGCFWSADAYRRAGGVDRNLSFCMDYDLLIKLCAVGSSIFERRDVAWMRSHPSSKSSIMHAVRVSERTLIVDRALRERPVAPWRLCTASYASVIRTAWRNDHLSLVTRISRTTQAILGFVARVATGRAFSWRPPGQRVRT